MRKRILMGGVVFLTAVGTVLAQTGGPSAYELASLREDVRLLQQRVGELSLTIEQLNRENASLQSRAHQNYVTLEQLNTAVIDINRTMQAALAREKQEVLTQVGAQLEKLAKQTQAAIDAVAKNQATRPAVQTNFSDDFPKEGLNYTVQAGDTLAVIAKKHSAKVQDIINANKIADPSKIQVGQTLFIPQGK
jgi:LysM repeat protein